MSNEPRQERQPHQLDWLREETDRDWARMKLAIALSAIAAVVFIGGANLLTLYLG